MGGAKVSCLANVWSCKVVRLFVRYPGDSYAGGNPWQLLTAAHAELFYLGAEAALKRGPHMRLVKFADRKVTTCGYCWGFGKKYIHITKGCLRSKLPGRMFLGFHTIQPR